MDSSSSLRGFGSDDEQPKPKALLPKSPSRRPFWSLPSHKHALPSSPPVLTNSSTLEELEAKHVLETLHLRFHTSQIPPPVLPPAVVPLTILPPVLPSPVLPPVLPQLPPLSPLSAPCPLQRAKHSCFHGRKVCVGTFGGKLFVPVSPGGLWEKKKAGNLKSYRTTSSGLSKRRFGVSTKVFCK